MCSSAGPPCVPAWSGGELTAGAAPLRGEAVPAPHGHLPGGRAAQVCAHGCLTAPQGLQGGREALLCMVFFLRSFPFRSYVLVLWLHAYVTWLHTVYTCI